MKIPIRDVGNKEKGTSELPRQFNEGYRPQLIHRAVIALRSILRQRYGASPEAGKRHSSDISKRRRKYRGCYGFGISRVDRKILSRRGTRMFWVGATSPQTRGGRRSHPPKSSKDLVKNINLKEKRKAIRSAMAATVDKKIVSERGHNVPETYPFIVESAFENIAKTADLVKTLEGFGFSDELVRSAVKKIRAGKGKMRGRKYRRKKGLLIVVGEECPIMKAGNNIPGIDTVLVSSLNAHDLAPGSMPGRATIWTENAIKMLGEKKLFI